MQQARFTTVFGGLSHEAAFDLMDKIEAHLQLDAIAVTINETDEAKALWETVAWFSTEAEAIAALALLKSEADHAAIVAVPERDWVRESLAGLEPVVAGRFYLHGSHDRAIRRHGGISLEIDAGTAFGTGHHGTTAGCLLALDAILKKRKPKRILDLGTGTGVLALAACAATKVKALGTDIDPEAVRVARLNARLNQLGSMLEGYVATGLHHPVIGKNAPYDLIFANILARPLAQLATGLSRLLAPGGALILSGLTVDQERWIRAAYRGRGLNVHRSIRNGNWIALVMTKSLPDKGRLDRFNGTANLALGLGYAQDV